MRNRWISAVFAAVVICGCGSDPGPLAGEDQLVVVQGYLFAGEPVDNIRLTQSVSLDATQTSVALSDIQVTLIRDQDNFPLEAIDDSGTYGYLGSDLTVAAGDLFELRVVHDDGVVTALTQVPPAPVQVALSTTQIYIASASDGDGFGGGFGGGFGRGSDAALTVTWNNEGGAYHQVFVASEDPDAMVIDRGLGDDFSLPTLQQQPTRSTSTDVNSLQLGTYGSWSVTVYRLNDEYGQLFEFGTQDPQDLEEPPSNIEGGLGIFTALHGSRFTFDVLPDTTG